MVVKKFFGKTTRDALRQVREELGADALILSNRPTMGGGVEIMAVADADVANLASTLPPSSSKHPARNAPPASRQPSSTQRQKAQAVNRAIARTYAMPVEPLGSPAGPRINTSVPPRATQMKPSATPPEEEPAFVAEPASAAADQPNTLQAPPSIETPNVSRQELKQINDEIKMLRSLLQSQLASFAWSDMEGKAPNRLELFRHLLAMGFSSALIRQLIDKMPEPYQGEVALKWARSALMHNLKCVDANKEMMERGGVFALVGPTGVGKTTTVAKLAARATMHFGAQHVALVTTDGYRIGAQDQLRIYGKILGVPVFSIQNEGDLQLTLADLSNRHIVLIDTVGMGQRDTRVLAQIEMLRKAGGRPIERLLLLAANTDGQTLEDVVKRYRGEDLCGCILSKVDESIALGPSLDIIIRNRLRLFYMTNGQRVPEDMHIAHAAYLVDKAMHSAAADSPFALQANEIPIMHAAQAGWL